LADCLAERLALKSNLRHGHLGNARHSLALLFSIVALDCVFLECLLARRPRRNQLVVLSGTLCPASARWQRPSAWTVKAGDSHKRCARHSTIEALNLQDLFFAQGYVIAQDRLWQMDTMRRFAAGELAEILGDDFLKHDREQRLLGVRIAAKKTMKSRRKQTDPASRLMPGE